HRAWPGVGARGARPDRIGAQRWATRHQRRIRGYSQRGAPAAGPHPEREPPLERRRPGNGRSTEPLRDQPPCLRIEPTDLAARTMNNTRSLSELPLVRWVKIRRKAVDKAPPAGPQ